MTMPNVQDELTSTLNHDAANLQGLVAAVELLRGTVTAAKARALCKCAEDGVDDFDGGLSDLLSDLQAHYSHIESELEERDGKLEREHERVELGKLHRHLSAGAAP